MGPSSHLAELAASFGSDTVAHGFEGVGGAAEFLLDPRDDLSAFLALNLDVIDPRPVRRMALELVPALDRPLAKLVLATDHLEGIAVRTLIDRQRQPPVALLGDHPVVHIGEPVKNIHFIATS